MKKCKFCAEDILDEAIKCRHCGSGLSIDAAKKIDGASTEIKPALQKDTWILILKIIGIIFGIFFAFGIWYISIPGAVVWYVWKKTGLNQKKKITITVVGVVISAVTIGYLQYLNRVPVLTIETPLDNASVSGSIVKFVGSVNPKNSLVKINNIHVQTNNGVFEYDDKLREEKNIFTINASNQRVETNSTIKKITVNRIFTAEEIAERERLKAEEEAEKQATIAAQEKAEAERKAKELAKQRVWDQSRAGQLCKKYPTWSKAECEGVADEKFWVGMSYDMLVTVMGGRPSSANPSNYGSGTQWQWCWYGYNPSCFYDNNDDGIIDSYN